MQTKEAVITYVDRLTEVENKLNSVGHMISESDKKRSLLRKLREDLKIISGVVRATDKTLQEAIGLLRVVQEVESDINADSHQKKKSQAFISGLYKRERRSLYSHKRGI